MPFDFKKQFRDQYQPSRTPGIVSVPAMRYVAMRGRGNPNEEGGAYQQAIELLYGISYTIKMSPKAGHAIDGYFEYVVSPLEGFWWQEGVQGVDYARKDDFNWISCIRLPDFVTPDEFAWAIDEATRKKRRDFSSVELLSVEEGTCVQCLHLGPYDDEPATVDAMHAVAEEQGYVPDFSNTRLHHEIYLSDPRRTAPDKLKTVIRHPVRRA